MGFDDKNNKKEVCHRSGTNGSVKNLHDFRTPGDSQKNCEKVTNHHEKQRPSNNGLLRSASADFRSPKSLFKSSIQKSSSGVWNSSQVRSSSAEPEFLRFWLEKDRAINKA